MGEPTNYAEHHHKSIQLDDHPQHTLVNARLTTTIREDAYQQRMPTSLLLTNMAPTSANLEPHHEVEHHEVERSETQRCPKDQQHNANQQKAEYHIDGQDNTA